MTSSNGNIFHVTELLAICVGNSPVPGEFPKQRSVTRGFDVYFDLRPNKRISKQSWGWWFETPSRPLWRHRNEKGIVQWFVPVLSLLSDEITPIIYQRQMGLSLVKRTHTWSNYALSVFQYPGIYFALLCIIQSWLQPNYLPSSRLFIQLWLEFTLHTVALYRLFTRNIVMTYIALRSIFYYQTNRSDILFIKSVRNMTAVYVLKWW